MLLREQHAFLGAGRQLSLLETLSAAATQMAAGDKLRPGPGPPPLISFVRALPPAEPFRPVLLWGASAPQASSKRTMLWVLSTHVNHHSTARGPFIYDPFSDKRHREEEASRPCQWVCGEMATVEVDVFNPASVGIKVDRLAVEAQHAERPAANPGAAHGVVTLGEGGAWKPMPTSLRVPALTSAPTRLQLIGAPAAAGTLVMTGCRVSTFGVTWHQPWAPPAPTIGTSFTWWCFRGDEVPHRVATGIRSSYGGTPGIPRDARDGRATAAAADGCRC